MCKDFKKKKPRTSSGPTASRTIIDIRQTKEMPYFVVENYRLRISTLADGHFISINLSPFKERFVFHRCQVSTAFKNTQYRHL